MYFKIHCSTHTTTVTSQLLMKKKNKLRLELNPCLFTSLDSVLCDTISTTARKMPSLLRVFFY